MVVALIKYERLPEFCFACGLLGYSLRNCNNETAKNEAVEGSATKYGSWLKAAPPEHLSFHNQRRDERSGNGDGDNSTVKNDGTARGNIFISEFSRSDLIAVENRFLLRA
ncbi:hypothetical protein ACOSQ4_010471 [Xanthoceras sorbifolium]